MVMIRKTPVYKICVGGYDIADDILRETQEKTEHWPTTVYITRRNRTIQIGEVIIKILVGEREQIGTSFYKQIECEDLFDIIDKINSQIYKKK